MKNDQDIKVKVSAEDLCELLLASYDGIDYKKYPNTSKAIERAQDKARQLMFDSGYWTR